MVHLQRNQLNAPQINLLVSNLKSFEFYKVYQWFFSYHQDASILDFGGFGHILS